VNGVGEPCAGEPHARFEAAGAGNGAPGHGHRSEAARRGNPGKSGCGTSRRTTPPRQPPTLPSTSTGELFKDIGCYGERTFSRAQQPDIRACRLRARGYLQWPGCLVVQD